ncbi:MAG: NUDIX hydrolase [Roseiflexus sp.]|jgi:ADP-ribose pyrophosphatase YjhB (NUDIX family)|nr:NUDIX hydrolase [Roseiflexus sp.]MBO9333872.1 NUDIX hydrolase [Roseiflexus sp.]MBO9340501.1 NUDIX hydrolase [Roseiflexus sp.]MBO9363724.1 NUDIX hydrolase [Roseiflexus sp.]MBO9380927.1 NUDIX hydrolase [Roseiflexus sp.]
MLDPTIEADIHTLAMRYGVPRRIVAPLDGTSFDPIARSDRYGEVCMVVRRRNGRLITAIKTFYPMGCFRLLTGGVTHGETIEAALQREVEEETGLQTVIRRFLAVIVYPPQRFATFAFLLDERSGELGLRDPHERIAAFREINVAELPILAATLEAAPDCFDAAIGGNWREWGRFRAVVHRVVYQTLSDDEAVL